MTHEDLRRLVTELRLHRRALENVEVKRAQRGTPKWLHEPLSAFVNRPGGGLIVFGLDEEGDFALTGVGDAHRLQEDIANLAAHEMEPPLRPKFTVDEIEGRTVVAVEIEELPATKKPCFFKNAGLPKGAYVRVGNTNRQMTEYEVFGYLSSRGQPVLDEEIVAKATADDLEPKLVDSSLESLRRFRPRAGYLDFGLWKSEDPAVAVSQARRSFSAALTVSAGQGWPLGAQAGNSGEERLP